MIHHTMKQHCEPQLYEHGPAPLKDNNHCIVCKLYNIAISMTALTLICTNNIQDMGRTPEDKPQTAPLTRSCKRQKCLMFNILPIKPHVQDQNLCTDVCKVWAPWSNDIFFYDFLSENKLTGKLWSRNFCSNYLGKYCSGSSLIGQLFLMRSSTLNSFHSVG